MVKGVIIFLVIAALGGFFLFMIFDERLEISREEVDVYTGVIEESMVAVIPDYEMRDAPFVLGAPAVVVRPFRAAQDVPPQKPLENSPTVIKGLYATSWSMSNQKKVDYFLELLDTTELNAIVIDVKDFSGFVSYDTHVELVEKYGAEQIRMPNINGLIKLFHDHGVYVIARLSVFQDSILAKARPDFAVKSARTGNTWYDRKGLAWMDPSNKEVWEYNVMIAREAASRGFDEINFDYIRFPSDGDIPDMVFSHWDKSISRSRVMRNFYEYVYNQMKESGAKLSADLFGLAASQQDDLGIGQIIENAYQFFDAVSPMIYPSHYAKGFLGFQNPAEHPAEVVEYSVTRALERLSAMEFGNTSAASSQPSIVRGRLLSKLRPWLQDFDLGAEYDATMVRFEKDAAYRAACKASPSSSDSAIPSNVDCTPEIGWMFWNPSNVYTREAFEE